MLFHHGVGDWSVFFVVLSCCCGLTYILRCSILVLWVDMCPLLFHHVAVGWPSVCDCGIF